MPRRPGGKLNPAKVSIAERRKRAVALRLKGWHYQKIADEIGYDVANAYRDVKHVMEESAKERREIGAQVLEMELQRLDMAMEALEPLLKTKQRLAAIDRLVKIQDRRAKYLGLDQATKHEAKIIKSEVYLPEKDEP